MSAVMLRSGQALTDLGHEVEYLFYDDLIRRRLPYWVRLLVIPFVLCLRVRQRSRPSAFDVVEIHRSLGSVYGLLSHTRRLSRRLPPCVVVCHGLEESLWEAMRSCWARAELPTSWRTRAVYRVLIGQAQLASRYAAGVIVLTEVDARHLVVALGKSPERVTVVHNGVESALRECERAPAPPDLRVLYFGTWLDRKGAADMAAAWSVIHQRWPTMSLTAAGTGIAAGGVLQSFDASCRDSVHVLPHIHRHDVARLLSCHDVLVLPSWYEGMPLAALEAAAAGMAIVTTRIAGTLEIFPRSDPELDGAILVDVQSPAQLAEAVSRLAADRDLLDSLQHRARDRAAQFTWESSAHSFAEAYEKAVSSVRHLSRF